MIDVDHRRRIGHARIFIGLMLGVSIAGFWPDATMLVLVIETAVWGLWFAAKGDELRALKIAQARGSVIRGSGDTPPLVLPSDN